MLSIIEEVFPTTLFGSNEGVFDDDAADELLNPSKRSVM